MKWNSSFAIGIEAIDEQHKKIFEHLLAIENSVAKRDPWHILHFLVAQLRDYVKFHLAVEEAFLEVIHYPDSTDHRDSHARLIEEIDQLEENLKRKASGENLVAFFEYWFVGHVLSSDRKYAAYVRNDFPSLCARRPAADADN